MRQRGKLMASRLLARSKADLLRIMASVPAGRVAGFDDIGAHLDLPPRQVAYILATLPDAEKAMLPWHRAVGAEGAALAPGQQALLAAEGATFDEDGCLTDVATRRIEVAGLPHGVPRRSRPANPPRPRRSRGGDAPGSRAPAGRHR
jgi:methylated-DNA-protein-cysteine methyltransferase-like protein